MTDRSHHSGTSRAWSVLLAVLLLWVAGGCQTVDRVAPSATASRDGQVFLVRGLFDVFSTGMNDLADELREEGVDAHTISGPQWPDLSRKIKDAQRDGRLQGPLVILGHSYGADDAVRLARSLEPAGIEVTMLGLIDATTPPTVPANVARCFNVFKSQPATDWIPALRGIAVDAASAETELVNYNIRDAEDWQRFSGVNHFNIEESVAVHELMIEEVLRVCPVRSARGSGSTGGGRVVTGALGGS